MVLVAGGGGIATDWDRVQPEVARFIRVCSYDPAGAGKSEPSPAAGSPQQGVNELRRLLLNARIRRPYALVGESWGGAIARVYASQHPELVAGMDLVDATHEDGLLGVNGRLLRPRLATDRVPASLRADMDLHFSTREGRPHPLVEMPLVVLSRGKIDYPPVEGTTPDEMFADHQRLQTDLVQFSQNSRQVVATTSGHSIHRDDPPAVIAAIREVVEAIRHYRRLDGAAVKPGIQVSRANGIEEPVVKKSVITIAVHVFTVVAIASSIAPTVLAKGQDMAQAHASPAASLTARVDKLFAPWNRSASPGCSLAISQNGVLVYEHGYGMASLELGVPITPTSVFHVASISKQFTAMCILLLAQRGKLSLDDEARKYIPELPDYGSPLTIRHLLTHTSGLRDVFLLLGLAAPTEADADVNDAIVRMLARQRALNFTPGSEYEYNNGGYALLATIVKRVSGQSLRAFADANIFKPLDMTHTHFHDDPTMIVGNRTSGYRRGTSGFRLALHQDLGHLVGNTGLFTTAPDLLLWEQNFAHVRVGDPALVAAMQKPTTLTGGKTSSYGFGLEIGTYRGLRWIGHGGGDPGYRAYVVRYPDQGLAIAVLGNLEEIDPARLAQEVADIYLSDAFPTPAASTGTATLASVSLSAEQLASIVGLYRTSSTGHVGRLFVRDGKLMASADTGEDNSVELTPVSASRFVVPGMDISVEFVPAAHGRAAEIRETGSGPKPIVSEKLEPFAPSSTELRVFEGEYTSPEVGVTFTLAARPPGLVLRMPGRSDVGLRPIFPDAFAGPAVNVVIFSRSARGAVTGFTVNTNGVRGLRFDRVTR